MITYRGCTIVRTEAVHADTGRSLYAIGDRLSKGPARPFLTSVREAKQWIDEQDLVASQHTQARAVVTPQGRYPSVGAAAAAVGITRQAAWERAQRGTQGWRFEDAPVATG
jgi:hypothetical protein